MTLDQLQIAYENMQKPGKAIKRDVLKRMGAILQQGDAASVQDLCWARKQAKGFVKTR